MDKIITRGNPNISIIIPVYNAEKYLERCLNSIFSQKFLGICEIITVNDASTDRSLEILKKYKKLEKCLRIIEHEVNRKVSITRFSGLKAATGDYIMFVDSDDWLLSNALNDLYGKCIESEADVLVFNHFVENDLGNRTLINLIRKEFITTDKHEVHQFFFGALWNKIIKRHLIENMICGQIEVSFTEDLLYGTEILLRSDKIFLLPQPYYVYFMNSQSLSRQVTPAQYLKEQILILSQLQLIIEGYAANKMILEDVLNYFEKWIYLEVAKINFLNQRNFGESKNFVQEFNQFPIMSQSRINRIILSMNNKVVNLFEVLKRFGIKMSLGILLRSFKKTFLSLRVSDSSVFISNIK